MGCLAPELCRHKAGLWAVRPRSGAATRLVGALTTDAAPAAGAGYLRLPAGSAAYRSV